jgi:hypothetical protein
MQLRSIITVTQLLTSLAPDLVLARGSTAVLAHAPAVARVPNDLDVFWLGSDAAVPDLAAALSDDPRIRVEDSYRAVAPPDRRVSALHRVDVLVWLSDCPRPSHRMWVDIATSRNAVPSETVQAAVTPAFVAQIKVMALADVLAEKLFVYVESTQSVRGIMRWSDLFDMLVLILAAPALAQLRLADVQVAVQRYFAGRAAHPPRSLPAPRRVWRPAWYRLVGPITRIAPDLDRAAVAAAAFWHPVLGDYGASVGARWDADRWRWA